MVGHDAGDEADIYIATSVLKRGEDREKKIDEAIKRYDVWSEETKSDALTMLMADDEAGIEAFEKKYIPFGMRNLARKRDNSPMVVAAKEYVAFRNAQKNPKTAKDELRAKGESFIRMYNEARESALLEDDKLNGFALYIPVFAPGEAISGWMNKMLKEYSAQKDKIGVDIYNEYENAHKALFEFVNSRLAIINPNEEQKTQLAREEEAYKVYKNNFLIAYRKLICARLKYDRQTTVDLTINQSSPASFADAMGSLIEAHVASSAKKLGFIGGLRNRKKIAKMF